MRMTLRTRVYIAGPISLGDQAANVKRAGKIGMTLLSMGYAPIIPQLTWFIDKHASVGTKSYEMWLEADKSLIFTCHALLRLQGKSSGADREVEWARVQRIPVFYNYLDLRASLPPTYSIDPFP